MVELFIVERIFDIPSFFPSVCYHVLPVGRQFGNTSRKEAISEIYKRSIVYYEEEIHMTIFIVT